jgi:tetratricopeptide (TPR) repeat protein
MKVLIRIGLSVLMILFLSIGLCYAQNVAVQSTTKGVDYAAQGKFKEANEEFARALKVDPSFGPAKRASKVMKDVSDQKIESQTAVHYFKGISYAIKGQYDQAISHYNQAIKIKSTFANAYISRGVAYAQSGGKYDQAISDFSKAIEISPQFAKAYKDRGFAYYNKGQYDQAISDYGKAIEINPRFARLHITRRENMRKPGAMSTRYKVSVIRFTRDFSMLSVQSPEDKDKEANPISTLGRTKS